MAYSRLYWQNGGPPAISADNLNHMDEGIAEAEAAAIAAATLAGTKADDNAVVKKMALPEANYKVYACSPGGQTFISAAKKGTGSVEPTDDSLPISTDGKIVVATPTENFHAANKKYVDDAIAALLQSLGLQQS